ncbi:MAG: nitrate/nitrite transporter NrtS [Myxococcales bacterium]|nr:nitrate/nitrite transporter NrtS [Myxococcales bacterium]
MRLVPPTWLRDLPRAAGVAVVVGTVLVLINHGDHLAREPACPHFWWKLAMSYATPLAVSLVSSALVRRALLAASRRNESPPS